MKIFKTLTSIKSFFIKPRIQTASEMLLNTNVPIALRLIFMSMSKEDQDKAMECYNEDIKKGLFKE